MSTTANTLITRALQLIGVVAAGEVPTADDMADGLLTLNDMVSALATEPLTIYAQSRTTKALTIATQTYTVGAGGSINVARPLWLPNAGIVPAGATNELPIDLLSDQQWANVSMKALTATFPTAVYYNYGFDSSGYGTVTVWPVPTTAPTLVLYLPTALAVFANGTTSYSFPPGYERMLRYSLAVELAPEYGRPLDPTIVAMAVQAKAAIKRANIRTDDLRVDNALLGRAQLWNWMTGE